MESAYLLKIAIILLCTKLLSLGTRKIKLPQVIGSLLAGVILGPVCFNIVDANQTLDVLAEIGVILIMFNAGMETDFKQMKKSIKVSFAVASLGVLFPLAAGYLLARTVFAEPTLESIFLGVILTATSLSITVEALNEMGKLKTPVGSAILGAAVIDDIIGIIAISIIISVKRASGSILFVVGTTLGKIIAFFILSIAVGLLIHKLMIWIYKKFEKKRRIPIFSLAFCLLLAFLAEQFGIADITGAYIAGLVLCNMKATEYIEGKVNVLSYMFFTPIFIASIGIKTNTNGFDMTLVIFVALFLLIAVFSKIAGGGLGAFLCKFSFKESLQIGIGMVSRGEVALIVANIGITAGLMNPSFFSPIVIVVILTTLIAPLLLRLAFIEKKLSRA